MSSHSESGHGHGIVSKEVLKVIGIGIRIIFDVALTAIVFLILWKAGMNGDLTVRGITYHSPNVFATGFHWTLGATAHGFARVFLGMWHLSLGMTVNGVFHNLFSWDTFTFVMDTAFVTFVTFCAYTVWRSFWLGGTTLVLGLLSLAWFVTMWALQLFGPLLLVIVPGAFVVGAVVKGLIWAVKTVWGWANGEEDH